MFKITDKPKAPETIKPSHEIGQLVQAKKSKLTPKEIKDRKDLTQAQYSLTREELKIDEAIELKTLLEKTPEELYDIFLKDQLPAVIEAWGLGQIITDGKEMLANVAEKDRWKVESKLIKMLMEKFQSLAVKKWAFFPEAMAKQKARNCSGAAMIFSHIMNNEFHIHTEQADPYGHAANVVHFSDGQVQYIDAHNQESFDIELNDLVEETDGFRVYKISKFGWEFSLLPIAKAEHGATLTYLENIKCLQEDSDKDPEAAETLHHYGKQLNQELANQYMENNFLVTRDNKPEWKMEIARKQQLRKIQKLPLLGLLFKPRN